MTATQAEARQIQIQTSNRRPAAQQQGGVVSAVMDPPTTADDGVEVLDGTGRSAVKTVLAVVLTTATAVELTVWGLITGVGWCALEGGARAITSSWTDTLSSGALTRVYLQVTATDGDLTLWVAPCGVDA